MTMFDLLALIITICIYFLWYVAFSMFLLFVFLVIIKGGKEE